MHNFMVQMCGSCLKQDVPLFDYMEENEHYKRVKNSSIIRDLFREDFNREFHNWKLCEDCSILLKGAVFLKKGLLSSQLIYRSYLRILNANNHGCNNQFSNLSVQLQDIRVKYETVEEATECNSDIEDRCDKSETQLDVENFGIDVLEIKDVKIEIAETNYEEMLNKFPCATEPTISMQIKAETETVVEPSVAEMKQHKVFLLSNKAQKEGSSGVSCLKVQTEMDAVADCNHDTQSKAVNLNCQYVRNSFKCNVCKQKFPKNVLLAHLRSHSDGKPYKCNFCREMFLDKTDFNRHSQTHAGEKPYNCDLCEKEFMWKTNYNAHRRTHTGEKPYKCDLCKKAFSCKQGCDRHTRIHTGEKPYKCDLCKKEFRHKSACNEHSRIHTGEKPYKCDLCAKAFTFQHNYVRHRRIHTGEKPYKCDLCKKAFSCKQDCDRHTRIHTGEKPYKCDLCRKEFRLKSACNEHSRIHTGEKPYKCDLCVKVFIHKSSFYRHRRIHTLK